MTRIKHDNTRTSTGNTAEVNLTQMDAILAELNEECQEHTSHDQIAINHTQPC